MTQVGDALADQYHVSRIACYKDDQPHIHDYIPGRSKKFNTQLIEQTTRMVDAKINKYKATTHVNRYQLQQDQPIPFDRKVLVFFVSIGCTIFILKVLAQMWMSRDRLLRQIEPNVRLVRGNSIVLNHDSVPKRDSTNLVDVAV